MRTILISIAFWVICLQGKCEKPFEQKLSKESQYYDITEKNITFRLYTRKNYDNGTPLITGDKNRLLVSGFKGTLPTKICAHGFMDNGKTEFIRRIKEGVLKVEEANFISLDWSACTRNVFYEQVVHCMKKAGRFVGELVKFLQREGKLDLSKTHMIGHSLGAHLMGVVSDSLKDKKVIGRITGLDPAGPLFEHVNESERLNSNSAKFVDIIHTCRIFTGMLKPIGTVDFYPNGGYGQPGCLGFDLTCNHQWAHRYFIRTIEEGEKNKYIGKKCATLNDAINGTCEGSSGVMGYHSEKSAPGMYYLKIKS